jgi:hypothetical protein
MSGDAHWPVWTALAHVKPLREGVLSEGCIGGYVHVYRSSTSGQEFEAAVAAGLEDQGLTLLSFEDPYCVDLRGGKHTMPRRVRQCIRAAAATGELVLGTLHGYMEPRTIDADSEHEGRTDR